MFVLFQKEAVVASDAHVILSAMLEVIIQVILTIDRVLPVTVSGCDGRDNCGQEHECMWVAIGELHSNAILY